MATPLPAGPYGQVQLGGKPAPYYMIPFDKGGVLQAPGTADRLVTDVTVALADGGVTDVIVITHGWNNDFDDALSLVQEFTDCLDQLFLTHGAPRAELRPLVVGVSWPSEILPGDPAPAMAALPPATVDLNSVAALGEDYVDPKDRPEFYQLAQSGGLDDEQALRLATLLQPLYGKTDSDVPATGGVGPGDTVDTWRAAQARVSGDEDLVTSGPTGRAESGPPPAEEPRAAGFLHLLNPLQALRLATVLQMKDRAGVIGVNGLGPLLARLLGTRDDVRVHLVGHSYGCKVSLSALSTPLPRKVRSTLLLEPALSYLAFAKVVPGVGSPGGYCEAKEWSELPVAATWSQHDIPLRDFFELACRRKTDLGEENIGFALAAAEVSPPSRFAAMGGWGAMADTDVVSIPIIDPTTGARYELSAERVLSVDGTAAISGHGAVKNAATAWILYCSMAV